MSSYGTMTLTNPINTMKQTHSRLYAQMLFLCIFLFFACSSPKEGRGGSASKGSDFAETKAKMSERIDKVVHSLPPPSEVPFILKRKGTQFTEDLVNSLKNLDQYLISNSKAAMNLGVYATDIGYLSTYNKVDEARQYMESCQKIAERLGISTAFGQDLILRFQNNAGNTDSLMSVINEAMERAEARLEDLDELRMASLALSGSFVESLYIITKVIEEIQTSNLSSSQKENNTTPLIELILEQQSFILDLKSVLKETERDANIIKLIDDVEQIDFRLGRLQEYVDEQEGYIKINYKVVQTTLSEIKRIREDIVTP